MLMLGSQCNLGGHRWANGAAEERQQVPEIRKLRATKVIVRPDRRGEYLTRWRRYADAATAAGARAVLFEDQVLPGRYLELTEHIAAKGMEGAIEHAFHQAELRRVCVRREGDELIYREVAGEPSAGEAP